MPLGLRGRPLVLRGGTRRDLHHTTPLVITALVRASRAGPSLTMSLTVVCILHLASTEVGACVHVTT